MTAYTPIYNLPYVEASDLVASYPTVSEELAENVETAIAGSGGLSLISPTSIANSGGTASSTSGTTTCSGVSSVSLNGVFSATYQSYRVFFTGTTNNNGSGGSQVLIRLRASGTDYSGSLHYNLTMYSSAVTASPQRSWAAADSSARLGFIYDTAGILTADITNPFAAANKTIRAASYGAGGSDAWVGSNGVHISNTSSYDGFTMFPPSGNTLTGTIRVYGYKGA